MIRSSLVLACLALLLLPAEAPAQYVPFGKNKIQHRQLDWHILPGEHVDVYYYPEAETLARLTLAYAEDSFRDLSRKFQHHPFRRIPLFVYASHQHFEETNIFPGRIPEGVLGFTEYLKRRVALPFRGDYAQFLATLRHEIIHYFQLSKLTETQTLHPRQRRTSPQQILWWTEGLAEYWSAGQSTMDDMYVRDLVLNGRLPTIRQFNYMYSYAAYPLGGELHRYLAGRFGDEYIVRMYEEYWKYDTFDEALEGLLGIDLDRLSREWHYDLQQRFFPVYGDRPPLEVGSQPVIYRGGGNFKPVVYTPPGDTTAHLLFLSPRTGYTNIYRTRLDRGERGLEVIVQGERSAEFESLHAWESRLHVNRDGVLAFVSKYLDRDALFLFDVERKRVLGRYQWPDLVGLKSPAWDPTATRVVFEGLTESGFSGLYVLDLETHVRDDLTQDRYRDESPHWSPDGRHIVFASDRTAFGADGGKNLFLFDLETREIRYLTYGPWIDQDPRWSHDGYRIAFSSDRTGSFDLYAVDMDGDGQRLTAMTGGAFDPAWLTDDDGIAFAGFSEGAFRIYLHRFSNDSGDHPTIALLDGVPDLSIAVPADGRDGSGGNHVDGRNDVDVADLAMGWEWDDLDAPILEEVEPERYRTWREISLDFAGGDAIVVPGVGAAQGAQFLATDMLGNHILYAGVTAVQASDLGDFIDNFSGNLVYLNLSRRLNYGAGVFRFKGLFRDVAWDLYQEETFGGYFIASYPFSTFQRLELQLGIERSNRTDVDDGFGSGFLGPDTRPDPRDLTRKGILTSNYVSFVRDNTLWLPTGPIDGERFNLTGGLLTCFSCTSPSEVSGAPIKRSATAEHYVLMGDYRRYIRTSMFSAYAVRAFGYYSDGAIPGRAVLGGTDRLRGYPRFSLAGSRVWLLNQEWRFPLLHALSFAFPFGELRLPGIQGAVFSDLGSSWLESQSPEGTWGSYGVSFRTSLGPPFVLRLDVGRRFAIGEEPPVVFHGTQSFRDTFVDFFFGFNY